MIRETERERQDAPFANSEGAGQHARRYARDPAAAAASRSLVAAIRAEWKRDVALISTAHGLDADREWWSA